MANVRLALANAQAGRRTASYCSPRHRWGVSASQGHAIVHLHARPGPSLKKPIAGSTATGFPPMIHTASTAAPLDFVLDGLMRRYRERVPDVDGVVRAMVAAGLVGSVGGIENDHIAFRTMGVPNLGIASFEKIFLHYGYAKRDFLRFDGKKLDAYWYAPPVARYPRIFISELCVDELSPESQRIIHSYTDEVTSDPVNSLNLDDGAAVDQFLHSPLCATPTGKITNGSPTRASTPPG